MSRRRSLMQLYFFNIILRCTSTKYTSRARKVGNPMCEVPCNYRILMISTRNCN